MQKKEPEEGKKAEASKDRDAASIFSINLPSVTREWLHAVVSQHLGG